MTKKKLMLHYLELPEDAKFCRKCGRKVSLKINRYVSKMWNTNEKGNIQ